jgi:hypothetical protein
MPLDWETYQTEHDVLCPGCGVSSGQLHKTECPDRWDAQIEADAKSGALDQAYGRLQVLDRLNTLAARWIERERKYRAASPLPGGYSDSAAMLHDCRRELQEAAGLVMSQEEIRELKAKSQQQA